MIKEEAPWLWEITEKVRNKKVFDIREVNTGSRKEVQFFRDNGSFDVNTPNIVIKPLGDCHAEIDIDFANIGKIKDPKKYQIRKNEYKKYQIRQKARELLKT